MPTDPVMCPKCAGAPSEVQAMCPTCKGYGRVAQAHEGEEQCLSCGRWLGPDSFEDGLRCKFCQEADERAAWPPNYPDSHDPTGPPSTDDLLGEPSAANVPEWARERVAEANRILLDTLEDALVRRAHLEAQIARIEVALRLDDASVLREGDVPEEAESDA